MSLKTIEDRQFNSFVDNNDGTWSRRVNVDGAVEGSFAPSGLKTSLKITNMTVGDTATAIPATPLTARNSIIVQNRSETESIFIGASNVTASGADEGWEIEPTSFFSTDVTDAILIYAIAPTGQTVTVKIMELA